MSWTLTEGKFEQIWVDLTKFGQKQGKSGKSKCEKHTPILGDLGVLGPVRGPFWHIFWMVYLLYLAPIQLKEPKYTLKYSKKVQ